MRYLFFFCVLETCSSQTIVSFFFFFFLTLNSLYGTRPRGQVRTRQAFMLTEP